MHGVLNLCDSIPLSVAKNTACGFYISETKTQQVTRSSCRHLSHQLTAHNWLSDEEYQWLTSHFRETGKSLCTWQSNPGSHTARPSHCSSSTSNTHVSLCFLLLSGQYCHTSIPTFSLNTHSWRPAKTPLFAKSWASINCYLPSIKAYMLQRTLQLPWRRHQQYHTCLSYQCFLTLSHTFDCVAS